MPRAATTTDVSLKRKRANVVLRALKLVCQAFDVTLSSHNRDGILIFDRDGMTMWDLHEDLHKEYAPRESEVGRKYE